VADCAMDFFVCLKCNALYKDTIFYNEVNSKLTNKYAKLKYDIIKETLDNQGGFC